MPGRRNRRDRKRDHTENSFNDSVADNASITGVSTLVSSLGQDCSIYSTDNEFTAAGDPSYSSDSKRSKKIDFYDVALTGRSNELSKLVDCFKRVRSTKSGHAELILISGGSGTGKSKLASALREPATIQGNAYFVAGKFEQSRQHPYSALAEAFTDLCDLLVSQQEQDNTDLSDISEPLEGETSILTNVIPNLSRLTEESGNAPEITEVSGKDSFTRFKLAIRKFVYCIASKKHPVVILLDDIQWADRASVEVVQSLLSDEAAKHLLILCTYRSDEMPEDLVTALTGAAEDRCTSIELNRFDLDQITALISNLTKMTQKRASALGELVLKRTDGNPFFVVKFMDLLQERKLLYYCPDSLEWTWDVVRIQEETTASDNVAEVLAARIQLLDESWQKVLRIAAVHGFKFETDIVVAVAHRFVADEQHGLGDDEDKIRESVNDALEVAMKQGLVEPNGDGSHKFCHDRIHECLYAMVPDGDDTLVSLHLAFARELQASRAQEDFVFCIADHLNRGASLLTTLEDKLDCAKVNLSASQSAMRKSAFRLSLKYAKTGIAALGDSLLHWDSSHYSVSLELYTIASEAAYCCADFEQCYCFVNRVVHNAKTAEDSIKARIISVQALGAEARMDDAIDAAFTAVISLGISLPKKPTYGHVVWHIMRTKQMLRGKTDAYLLSLPDVHSERSLCIFKLLGIASHYASITTRIPHLCIAILRLVQLSVSGHGAVPPMFSAYGVLETVMGNLESASRFGRIACELQQIKNNRRTLPVTATTVHQFIYHWRHPLRESMQPMLNAYQVAMEIGYFDFAFLSIQGHMQIGLFTGVPLSQIEEQMSHYCPIMNEFEQKSQLYTCLPLWQLCLNFMGRGATSSPVILTGDAMEEDVLEREAHEAGVQLVPQMLTSLRLILAYHFSDKLRLRQYLRDSDSMRRVPVGHFLHYTHRFYFALSCIELYRTSGERSYLRKARKEVCVLRKWDNEGCVNTTPLLALLDAEMEVLDPKRLPHVAIKYELASQEANKADNMWLDALVNERMALFFDSQRNEESTVEYLRKAINLYRQWCGFAKVEKLEIRLSVLTRGVAGPPTVEITTE